MLNMANDPEAPVRVRRSGAEVDALMLRVCERICAGGKTISQVCRELGTTHSDLWHWSQRTVGNADAYARAQAMLAHSRFDETLEIADNATSEDVQVARLRVDTRFKVAAKLAPKVYGDKYVVEGGPEPIVFRLVRE